jgi:lysophospholipase L1-like esterase
MFLPERVELVRDARTGAIFSEGKDYTLHGRTLLLTAGSKIPFIRSGEFPKDKYPWFEANGRHLLVTYDHRLKWDGPIAEPQGSRFPNVMAKLKRRERLRVVAYGDSITHGLDVSSYLKQAPHMPTWAQMFVDELSAIHHDGGIELYNTALPGATSQWGIDNEEIGVTSINPDLVIIAFGMNDFWSLTPEQFKENIEKMLTKLHASCPKAEAVLVASMPFDPIYTSEQTYCENLAGYPAVLKSLAGPGVGFVDMYSIGKALYDAKKPKDLIENPMHPNDFLARWYAQSLIAALTD